MSRRKRRAAYFRPARKGLIERWTIQRATMIGIIAGLLALLLGGLFGTAREPLLYFYAFLLLVTAACAASILWITASDMRDRGTSGRMRPIRAFDLAVGAILLIPSVYALTEAAPALGL